MPVETGQFISDLNPLWPTGTDLVSAGDDHDRLTKAFVQQSFPNIDGVVTCKPADLNLLAGAADNGSGLALTGFIQMYAVSTAPNGWLLCNGAAIPVEHTDLIALIGSNTPDMRALFVRGWSSDAVIDPDGPKDGLVGQAQDFLAHQHSSSATPNALESHPGDNGSQPKSALGSLTGITGGAETRPVNMSVVYLIKT